MHKHYCKTIANTVTNTIATDDCNKHMFLIATFEVRLDEQQALTALNFAFNY